MPIIGTPTNPSTFGATSTFAALGLNIGGTDVTAWIQAESYEINEALNQRNTCRVTVLPPYGSAWRPQVGQSFLLTDDSEHLFAGTVENVTEQTLDENLLQRRAVQVEAVDYNQIPDRRLVAAVYENMTCGDIVRDLITNYLAADGIAVGFVDAGVTVVAISFPYATVSDALTQLATLSGFSWNIDYYGGLYFFARTYQISPFEINSANAVFRGLKSTATRDQYRNSQIVWGGTAITIPQLEKTAGDGRTQTFVTTYPIDRVPVIMRNTTSTGSAQTVQIRDLGVVGQWYWNKGQNEFNQGSTETVLTSTEYVAILYQGQYPLLTLMDNAGAIAARQAVEGGSGRYESVVQDANATTDNLATLEASALLAQYGNIKQDIDFVTVQVPVHVGDLLTVWVPELGIAGQFLATNVRVKNWKLADREYTVTASNGQFRGDFTAFFRALVSGGPVPSVTNQVVARPIAQVETITLTDSLAVPTAAPMNLWGYAKAGQSEWSAFVGYPTFVKPVADTVPIVVLEAGTYQSKVVPFDALPVQASDARPTVITGAGAIVKVGVDTAPVIVSEGAPTLIKTTP